MDPEPNLIEIPLRSRNSRSACIFQRSILGVIIGFSLNYVINTLIRLISYKSNIVLLNENNTNYNMYINNNVKFHIIDLPPNLYDDYINFYNESFPNTGLLNEYSSLSQHARDIALINELKHHKHNVKNIAEIQNVNIFIIPNVLALLHDADYTIRYEYDNKLEPNGIKWKHKYPNGWRHKNRYKYWENVVEYLNAQTFLSHCFHNNINICHFYVPLCQSWTVHIVLMDYESYSKYKFRIIANSIHPISTPDVVINENNKHMFNALFDAHIIAPYYHSTAMINKYNLLSDHFIPSATKRKYFASAAFTLNSMSDANEIRYKIFTDINNECNDNIQCMSYKFNNRSYTDFNKIFNIYKQSIFCAATLGDTANSRRIYTEIIAGCIPVLISCDKQWFAFETFLNWTQFSVIIPEKHWKTINWITYLKEHYSTNTIQQMHQKLMKIRLNMIYLQQKYKTQNNVVDAVELIVMEMQKRSLGLESLQRWIKLNY